MSGFEIAGLVLAVMPLLERAVQAATTLRQRCQDFHLAPKKMDKIETRLNAISNDLNALHRQYGQCQLDLPAENASIFENEFNDLASTLTDIAERFSSTPVPSRKSFLQFFKQDKIKRFCNEAIAQLDHASERLRNINQSLVNVTTTQNCLQFMSFTQDDIKDKLDSLQISIMNSSKREDTYIPSYHVPANPLIAKQCLDYASVDDEGNPETLEGKLKAELLSRIKERRENSSALPIVGAVGMSGVGKTCAVRGLGAEKDIRDLFTDGILFLSFGQRASDEDFKRILCSIVSQTGGRVLSREMTRLSGENATKDIIRKVSDWFKDRKLLFLVDDIWNSTATGPNALTKLSTILESCDITSGLVYTTGDKEIAPFDATLRFESLPPTSNACRSILAKAAGFLPEQVDEADQQDAFEMIMEHCGGLKMALVVAGKNVRLRAESYGEHKAKAWETYASALNCFPQKLLIEDCGEYSSLNSQFSVTIQTLSSLQNQYLTFQMPYNIEEAFQALSVASKGQVLLDSMLCRLWDLSSTQHAREVAHFFVRLSLVERTCEFVNGQYCEGFRMHDLVNDFANYLADQNCVDRNWIKGWEVWALRLLESCFGADQNVVSSSEFLVWWEETVVRGHYFFEDFLSDIISRIQNSRTESGQSLRTHSGAVDRVFEPKDGRWEIVPLLTVRKRTLVEMHNFMTTLAGERDVKMSDLTYRLVICTSLVVSGMADLLNAPSAFAGNHFAVIAVTNVLLHIGNRGRSCPWELYFAESLIANMDEYLRHVIEFNWTFYDECVKSPDLVEDERYRLLGLPLEKTRLTNAGIGYSPIHMWGAFDTFGEVSGNLTGTRSYEWTNSHRRFLVSIFIRKPPADAAPNYRKSCHMYVHELPPPLGNIDGVEQTGNDTHSTDVSTLDANFLELVAVALDDEEKN